MSRLSFLRLTLTTCAWGRYGYELDVEVQVGGDSVHVRSNVPLDDFECFFDRAMEKCGKEIKRLVKEHSK